MTPKFNLRLFFTLITTLSLHAQFPKKLIVNVAVANLRAIAQAHDPSVTLPTSDLTNPLQITQLLLGEQVIAHQDFIDAAGNKWFKVNTLQQEYFYMPIGWHGYPGWLQADQLIEVDQFPAHNVVVKEQLADLLDSDGKDIQTISIGTRLCCMQTDTKLSTIILPNQQIAYIDNQNLYFINQTVTESNEQLRKGIMHTACKFIGNYYSWGGRKSAQHEAFGLCSVDCSALIHLSFLAHGLQIPRMSHEQYLRSDKIQSGADLQPGDLIFFASVKKNSARMDHVMLYLGNDQILESTFAGEHKVRVISSQQRHGKPIAEIASNDIIDDTDDQYHIYFGSFFNDKVMIQKLRDDALCCKY